MATIVNLLDYNLVEGDDKRFTFSWKDEDGNTYDFTGTTKIWFTVKKKYEDDDTDAKISLNSSDDSTQVKWDYPNTGDIWIWLTPTETTDQAKNGIMYYDIQLAKTISGDDLTDTPQIGAIQFISEVTEALIT